MASSSSSASNSLYWKYDVFLSFRGEDTRRNFTSHLYQDDKRLENGDSISEELGKAIEVSQVAVIVFSRNYAMSRWCLNELVKVMECKEKENGQTVIPIFCDVDPSHVRYQSKSFEEAFAKHESRYKDDVEGMQKVQGWRTALTAAANLKGYVFPNGVKSDADCIEHIVDQISSKCNTSVSYLQEVVGIDTQLRKVESLLQMEINDVRIVWIWGMGGVGEKDNSVDDKEAGRSMLSERLQLKKVLVVLDDIDHIDQLDYLAKDLSWFGKGSRIIATTRDKQKVPNERFKNLTLKIVSLAKGHPLALKVWGSSLHRMDITEWESALVRIKKNSDVEITENLKISYDGLEPEEQEIFLDIACFFRGIEKEKVMQVLESYYSGPKIGLRVLVSKSLVIISENNEIEMHDLIQDMGKCIVQMQEHPGEYSRLWNVKDFKEVIDNNMGTMAVEAIWFTYFEELSFNKEAMKSMKMLRILCIRNSYCQKILIPKGSFMLISDGVHCIIYGMKQRGSKNLKRTPDFKAMPNLEYLDLSECRSLEEVQNSLECCRTLIKLNLNNCVSLKRFPSVNVESLRSLNLGYCYCLEKFPEILGIMKPELQITMSYSGIRELPLSIIHPQAHLTDLHLLGLKNLVSLPSSICKLKGLVRIDVSFCVKLERLPEEIGDLENLKLLDAHSTLISRPPSSIVRLNKLKFLNFAKRVDGVYFFFPQVDEGLCSLKELDLSYCNLIDGGLPEDIGSLSSLEELKLFGNNFEHLPQSISELGALRLLNLSDCKRLTQLPEFPQQLDTIHADWSNDSICNSLFQNISSLQHDICTSDSISLRVFTTGEDNIPRWFHHLEDGTSIFVKLPKNWPVTCIAQKLALSSRSKYRFIPATHFFLVPLTGLLDKLKANGKTPNDYGCIKLTLPEECKLGSRYSKNNIGNSAYEGHMFLLFVTEQLESWPEKEICERTWMSIGTISKSSHISANRAKGTISRNQTSSTGVGVGAGVV
ncbi:hypothetical protein KY284_006989 [Solanum tuberosum]|nr:hypothetical protein KY284_006989 [Solanum tuberosum]